MQQYPFNVFQYTSIVLGLPVVFIVISSFSSSLAMFVPSSTCTAEETALYRANLMVEMSLSTDITFLPTLRAADAPSPAKYKIIIIIILIIFLLLIASRVT